MYHFARVSILALLAIAGGFVPSSHLFAQFRDWNTSNGNWSESGNWSPNLVPGITDIARIGLLPAAHSAVVDLDMHTAIGGLQIYDGMSLHTNGASLTTAFDTLITGENEGKSELRIQSSIFNTRHLTNEGQVTILPGTANVSGLLANTSDGRLVGQGTVNLTSNAAIAFRNDGLIYGHGLQPFTFNQLGDGLMDLDGSSGNGSISSGPNQTTITFIGTQLADAFSGSIRIHAGDTLNMNFSAGWTADTNSEITLAGSGSANPGVIRGGNWTMEGSLLVESTPLYGPGNQVIEAATILGAQSSILVRTYNAIAFDGPVTLDGGTIALEENADLTFNSNTLVNGGTFTTHSQLGADGTIAFNGITAWQGDVSIAGNARQNGTALISGNTTIEAGIFDMDGLGNTSWNVNAPLAINAEGIDSTISNSFDGTINVQGGLSNALAVNLGRPDQHWTMAGAMNLTNHLNLGVYRVHGSEMRVTGDLNIDGPVGVSADLNLAGPAHVSFATPDSVLFFGGSTRVEQSTSFLGEGTLHGLSAGELVLADGAALNEVDVINQSLFRIGDATGIASLDNIDFLADGTWEVEIGGYVSGDTFDHLLVGGTATLGGILNVDLIDAGFGLFAPQEGDEFKILTSIGGVSGLFEFDPITFSAGREYQWEVLYNPHDVTLRLADVTVPEPATAALLSLAATIAFHAGQRTRRFVL